MIRAIARWTILILIVGWSAGPAVWQALTAIKPDAQITQKPTVYLPSPPTTDHIRALWERKPFGRYLLNSAVVAGGAMVLSLAAAAGAASVIVHLAPRRRTTYLQLLLVAAVFPPILLLFPLFEMVRALHLMNNPIALIVPYAALNLPLAIWVLEHGFGQIPREIDEAARLDGLSAGHRLWRIHLPLALPSLATAAILVFIFAWNEFMFALTFITRDAHKTVTAGIASVSGASLYEIPWGPLSAAIVIATLPLMALVLVFQRKIISGFTRGAVKG